MKLLELLLSRPRLTLALTLLASAGGAFAWFTMPREEDPRLAERMGLLVVPYPGAEPADIERHVVGPIEDALSEVDSVEEVAATLRTGIAILSLELRPDVAAADTDRAWDEVEDALADARRLMPDEVLPGELDHALVDTESVLLALHGPSDVLALSDAADALEDRLLGLDDVSRVERAGDPGERVLVDLDDAAARRLGLDPLSLGQLLARRNVTTPGGALQLDGRRLLVRPLGDLRSVEEIAALPLPRPDGSAVPLGSVARVRRATDGPLAERVRHESSPAIVLGVVPRRGLQAERFGEAVQARVDAFAAAHPELEIATLAFQPARVKARLGELGGSLLLGVGIVAAIVFLLMGVRMGLVVASVVPLVTFASLTVYAASGGVLHQMAVAALVVALGLLVDNAIVVAETIQRRLDEGQAPGEAARASVRELALPLGAATGTTLASFVPMLLAEGTTGDFTRAIPVVVMLTLGVSYGYALLVTPLLARLGLRPRPARASRVDALGARLGAFAARRPGLTLLVALGLLGASGAFATQVRFDFFPSSDRNQLVIEVELPEGSHLEATDEASRRLEAALRARPEVTAVTAFVGRSVPSFYYNLPRRPAAPHVAQLLVTTRAAEDVDPVLRFAEALPRREGAAMPDAQVLARRLEQGPPVRAPIEIRLYGDDLADLQLASDEVRRALRATPGARSVRADHGPGLATLRVAVDDAAAARQGVDRAAVAVALLGHARGLPAGTYRGGDDPAPIVVRSSARGSERGEHQAPLDLTHADVPRPGRSPVPLAQVGRATLDWQPAVIHRRGRQRVVGVLAEHEPDVTYASVVSAVTPKLEALELPEGVSWEMAGAFGESAKANAALGAKGPLAALLLVLILLAEFDSFRRVLIVLATAPLAFLGVWPGLALLGLPFGFVALLGAIALIGIAVNGAIVLLDVADRRRREGASVAEALEEAVRLRARPILLTTATTVAGLLPLLASESTLWPPMAAAMISGLVVATLLTLAVVPALYRLFFRGPSGAPSDGESPDVTPGDGTPGGAGTSSGAGRAGRALAVLAILALASPLAAQAPRSDAGRRTGAASRDASPGGAAEGPSGARPGSAAAHREDSSADEGARDDAASPEDAALEAAAPRFDLEAMLSEPGAPPLSEAEAVRRALDASSAPDRVEAAVRRAEAGVRAARTALFPELTLRARYTRLSRIDNDPLVSLEGQADPATARALVDGVDDQEARLLLGGFVDALAGVSSTAIEVPQNQYAFSAGLVYPVSAVLASVLPRWRGARRAVAANEAQREAVLGDVALRARETYLGLLRARSLFAVARHRRLAAEHQLGRVRAAVRAGAAPRLALHQAEALAASTRVGETRAEAGVQVSAEALATLLHAEGAVTPVADLDAVPAAPDASLAELVARARRERPEGRALRAALEAQGLLVRAAEADRYPTLALSANVDVANPNTLYVPLRDRFDESWDVSVVLAWSPSAIGRGNAAADRARADADAARADLQALEEGIRVEVAQAFHALRAASVAHAQSLEGVEAAEAAWEASRVAWARGAGPFGDVVDADAALTAARVRRIDAAIEARLARARLDRALGALP